jgi:hypothetical protein
MRLVRSAILLAALVAATATLAGCGGGDDEGTTTAAATSAPAQTETSDEHEEQTDTGPPVLVTATLTAANAVPKGPAGASGTARLTLDVDTGEACWTIAVKGLDRSLSAHVHEAPPGKVGPVVIPLGDRFSRKGCVLSSSRALREVAAEPGDYYVDVHTVEHLDAAVRGRLRGASD